jgi:hypothetical protein
MIGKGQLYIFEGGDAAPPILGSHQLKKALYQASRL